MELPPLINPCVHTDLQATVDAIVPLIGDLVRRMTANLPIDQFDAVVDEIVTRLFENGIPHGTDLL